MEHSQRNFYNLNEFKKIKLQRSKLSTKMNEHLITKEKLKVISSVQTDTVNQPVSSQGKSNFKSFMISRPQVLSKLLKDVKKCPPILKKDVLIRDLISKKTCLSSRNISLIQNRNPNNLSQIHLINILDQGLVTTRDQVYPSFEYNSSSPQTGEAKQISKNKEKFNKTCSISTQTPNFGNTSFFANKKIDNILDEFIVLKKSNIQAKDAYYKKLKIEKKLMTSCQSHSKSPEPDSHRLDSTFQIRSARDVAKKINISKDPPNSNFSQFYEKFENNLIKESLIKNQHLEEIKYTTIKSENKVDPQIVSKRKRIVFSRLQINE